MNNENRHIYFLLQRLHAFGVEQVNAGQEILNRPIRRKKYAGLEYIRIDDVWIPARVAMMRIQTNPQLLLWQTVKCYWILFNHALSIFDKPVLQFLIRPLMEIAYSKVVYFSQLSLEEQKQISIKSQLCTVGLLLAGRPSSGEDVGALMEQYTELISSLNDDKDRDRFSGYVQNGYSVVVFQKLLHALMPSVLDSKVKSEVDMVLDGLWAGTDERRLPLDIQFRYMSMSLHSNIHIIGQLENEKEDHAYILRCGKAMYFTGATIIKQCQNKYGWNIKNPHLSEQTIDELGHLFTELWEAKQQKK